MYSYHKLLEDSIRPIDTRRAHVKASLREYTDRLTQLQHRVKVRTKSSSLNPQSTYYILYKLYIIYNYV